MGVCQEEVADEEHHLFFHPDFLQNIPTGSGSDKFRQDQTCPSQDVSVLEPVSVDSDSESNPDSESTVASEATTVIDVDEIINQQEIQNFQIAPTADADGLCQRCQ